MEKNKLGGEYGTRVFIRDNDQKRRFFLINDIEKL